MDDRDVDRIISHPAAMIASDGEIPVFGRDAPHPRSYGTFARVLSEYVGIAVSSRSNRPCARCQRCRPGA